MSAYRGTWRGLAAVALVAAACSDSTGPQLSDPQQLSSDLQTVSSTFATPAFQSFSALGMAAGSPVPASARAGALLSAARITAPQFARQPYADVPARLQALRSAAPALGSPLSADVIPSPLWGKTFVWDVTTHQYIEDPSPAVPSPSTGVRIILYAVDPITEQVVEPPVAVGYVDLIDQSSAPTDQLQVIVSGGTPANPGIEYVNYVVTASVTLNGAGQPTAFSATAVGDVRDGTRQVHFDASFSATNLDTDNPDAAVHVAWDLDTPPISVVLDATLATSSPSHAIVTIDFTVTRGGETVRLSGTVEVDALAQTVTANLAVYVGGSSEPSAVIRGTADATHNGITIRRGDGGQLSQHELQALLHLFELSDHLLEVIENLFHPCESLMGA